MQLYFTSILIYAILILASVKILAPLIEDNGWLDSPKYQFNMNKNGVLFCICAIPIFRLLILISFFYLAFNKKG